MNWSQNESEQHKKDPERPMPKRGKKPDMSTPTWVGANLRRWRLAAGMSQEAVGAEIDCTKSHLSQVENGRGTLSLGRFMAFCMAIGVPPSRVLEEPLLSRERDIDRLAKAVIQGLGTTNLRLIDSLTREELRTFVKAGKSEVDRTRLESENRRLQDELSKLRRAEKTA